jgi:hypothetical protein
MSKVKIYNGVTIDMSTSEVIKQGEVRYINSSDVSYCGSGGGMPTTYGGAKQNMVNSMFSSAGVKAPDGSPAVPYPGSGDMFGGSRGGLSYGEPTVQPMPAVQPPTMGNMGPGSMGPGSMGPGSMQPQPMPAVQRPAVQPPLNMGGGGVSHMGPGSMGPPPVLGNMGPGSMGPGQGNMQRPMPAVQPPMNIAPPAPGMGGGYQTMGPEMGTSAATGTPQGGTNGK